MDIKEIQNLIKFVSKAGVSEVSIEQGEFKITIKTPGTSQEGVFVAAPVTPTVVQPLATVQNVVTSPVEMKAPVAGSNGNDEGKYVTIKSPMIGTFYRKPSPDKDLFVNVGDSIQVGTVLCVVEAMKLFNEIESEISGRIVKILVDDASPIEYDQPLFLVDPA